MFILGPAAFPQMPDEILGNMNLGLEKFLAQQSKNKVFEYLLFHVTYSALLLQTKRRQQFLINLNQNSLTCDFYVMGVFLFSAGVTASLPPPLWGKPLMIRLNISERCCTLFLRSAIRDFTILPALIAMT